MTTLSKLSIRLLGVIMASVMFFMIIEAAVMPWDGFKLSTKMIIGKGTQYK